MAQRSVPTFCPNGGGGFPTVAVLKHRLIETATAALGPSNGRGSICHHGASDELKVVCRHRLVASG